MSFANMKLAYNNALRKAQEGDDGTSYALCALAKADAADDHKVRGSIVPCLDITDLTGLVGAQLRFDATENRYNVVAVDASPFAAAETTLLNLYAENMHGQTVQVGSYAYAIVNKTVVKLDTTIGRAHV